MNLIISIAIIAMTVSPLFLYNKIKMTHLNLQFKLKRCKKGHQLPRRSQDAVLPSMNGVTDHNCQQCLQEKVKNADRKKMMENKEDFKNYNVDFTIRPIT